MTDKPLDTPQSIAFMESRRAIESQPAAIDELRSRTGIVLAASAVSASFLGAAAAEHGEFSGLDVLALLAFIGSLICSLYVLWPRRNGWTFVLGAKTMLEDWRDRSAADLQAFLAENLEKHYDANKQKLDRLYYWFQAASVFLGVQVVLWIAEIAKG